MERYGDKSGNSGVRSFAIGKDSITVRFVDGTSYRYDYTKPGKRHVEAMKKLARAGKGLATYINKYVRGNFAGQV